MKRFGWLVGLAATIAGCADTSHSSQLASGSTATLFEDGKARVTVLGEYAADPIQVPLNTSVTVVSDTMGRGAVVDDPERLVTVNVAQGEMTKTGMVKRRQLRPVAK